MSERRGVYVSGRQGRELEPKPQLHFDLDDGKCLVCGELKTEVNEWVRDPERGYAIVWRDFDGRLCCPLCYMHRFGEFARMLASEREEVTGAIIV